jgi:hypothetical protein
MLTVDNIKAIVDGGQAVNIKYVRVEEGFRYAEIDGPLQHIHLIREGEKAISAGFFSLFSSGFVMSNAESFSLGLGPKEEDSQLLKAIFNENH